MSQEQPSTASGFGSTDAGRSIARYIGLSMREQGEPTPGTARMTGTARAADHLRAPGGNVYAGALLTMADSVAGLCSGLAALPGWVVSTNLMLHVMRVDDPGDLRLDAHVLRAGRNAVVTAVRIVTDSGRLVADGMLTSAVLSPVGGPPEYARPLELTAPVLEHADPATWPEFLGTRAIDATTVALDIAPLLRNPWGILHGGAIAALVDTAAEHVTGPGSRTADVALHFLAPGRVGPVAARAERIGTRADGELVRVEVVDVGAADRVMALAIVVVQPA